MGENPKKKQERASSERKPYRPPRIVSREKLELVAVVCVTGKTDVATCPMGPIGS